MGGLLVGGVGSIQNGSTQEALVPLEEVLLGRGGEGQMLPEAHQGYHIVRSSCPPPSPRNYQSGKRWLGNLRHW